MVRGGDEMSKNQKPSMSKRRATVAAVLCFVAAIAIAGTYTFNDYRKTQKNELAKAEEKAKQDSEAAKETGTSKIKNEDMTNDTDESDSNGTGKDGTTTGSGTTDSGAIDSGTTGTSGSKETGTSGSSGQTGTQATAGKSHNINFTEDSYILWPVNGAVIMSYSMDKTVYFQTLDQYKYNPGRANSAPLSRRTSTACTRRQAAKMSSSCTAPSTAITVKNAANSIRRNTSGIQTAFPAAPAAAGSSRTSFYMKKASTRG